MNQSSAEVEKLGPQINSEFNESDPYISPDEKILIFSSSAADIVGQADRPETMKGPGVLYARGDLYVSTNRNGTWTPARHLKHNINSVADVVLEMPRWRRVPLAACTDVEIAARIPRSRASV